MKLKELFKQLPVLTEDNIFMGNQSFTNQKISFDSAHSRSLGTFNRITIWGTKCLGDRYDIYGILEDESPSKILAWCVFDTQEHPGYSQFVRAYVKPLARGQGLTLTIMNFVITKAKEKVIIDKNESTSSSSRKMIRSWIKLGAQQRHFDMKFMLNGVEIKGSDIDNSLKDRTKNDVEIFFESERDYSSKMFGYGERVLHEFVWYDKTIGLN